jgi:hypothetical protein
MALIFGHRRRDQEMVDPAIRTDFAANLETHSLKTRLSVVEWI